MRGAPHGEDVVLNARDRFITLIAAGIVAAACGPTPTATKGGQSSVSGESTSPATPDPRCAALERRGVTPCPPARLALESIAIHNGTRGAVDDRTVRTQGQAYVRGHALYAWAVRQATGDTFLMSGAIVPSEVARTNIFRAEVRYFSDARATGGTVRIEPLQTTDITLVAVPQSLQEIARRDGLVPSPYAWVDNQSGPARVTMQSPGGGARDVLRIAPGEPHPILVFGQVREDAELGSIWYAGGDFGCLSSVQLRAVCQV